MCYVGIKLNAYTLWIFWESSWGEFAELLAFIAFINYIIEKILLVIYTTIKYLVLFLLIMIWKM